MKSLLWCRPQLTMNVISTELWSLIIQHPRIHLREKGQGALQVKMRRCCRIHACAAEDAPVMCGSRVPSFTCVNDRGTQYAYYDLNKSKEEDQTPCGLTCCSAPISRWSGKIWLRSVEYSSSSQATDRRSKQAAVRSVAWCSANRQGATLSRST